MRQYQQHTPETALRDMMALNITGELGHHCLGLDTAALGIAKRLEYHSLLFIEDHAAGPMVTRSCAGSYFIKKPCAERLSMVLST